MNLKIVKLRNKKKFKLNYIKIKNLIQKMVVYFDKMMQLWRVVIHKIAFLLTKMKKKKVLIKNKVLILVSH